MFAIIIICQKIFDLNLFIITGNRQSPLIRNNKEMHENCSSLVVDGNTTDVIENELNGYQSSQSDTGSCETCIYIPNCF